MQRADLSKPGRCNWNLVIPLTVTALVSFFLYTPLTVASGNGWVLMPVPGTWEQHAPERFGSYDGIAWYRCYVRVPDRWVSRNRDLWVQSVTITVEYVADAYEVYVNGKKVGAGGRIEPFEAAPDGLQRFKIPPGVLQKGVFNTIAIRVYNAEGEGGFKGRAPVIAGYFLECVLAGPWEFRTGDDPGWAIGPRKERPKSAVFEKFRPAVSPLQIPTTWIPGRHLPPAESLRRIRVSSDLAIDQLLTEPLIAQPLSISFDERGRLWLVEYRQYPYPAGLKMVSRDHYYRAVYDRVPEPPPFGPRGADVISIHWDANGDGKLDRHRNFLSGLNIATSVAFADGGIWVLNPPYLLFYADKDHDDRPDGPPVVHLEGFGLEDTHSVTNSLTWGPDGWLYGAHGSTVSSRIRVVRRPATKPWQPEPLEKGTYIEGPAIWRYHPKTGRFEIFAEGGGNAFGITIDSKGRLFSGYNGGSTRGFYYIQGAYYVKGATGKYGPPSNPYAFGHLPAMETPSDVPRFSHHFIRYESTELPPRFRGNLLAVDPLHKHVVLARMEPVGASFRTVDVEFPVASDDIAFRPVEIELGPDGAVYIADFCEEFIAHGQHFQGQIDKATGRVYRLRSKNRPPYVPVEDLGRAPTVRLLELLRHPNIWYRRTALRILAERGDRTALEPLYTMLRQGSGQEALEALWGLNLLGAFDAALARETLHHRDPFVRLWTVRLLGDSNRLPPELVSEVAGLARREKHPEVRAQLAATAKRLPGEQCLAIVRELLRHDDGADDPFLPWLTYWALEAKATSHRDAIVALFKDRRVWSYRLVREFLLEHLMRRFALAGTRADLLACARLLQLAPDRESAQKLLAGFELAFRGRSLAALPEELVSALAESGGGSLALQVRMGRPEAVAKAVELLKQPQPDPEQAAVLAEVLGEIRAREALPVLLHLVRSSREPNVLSAAILALQNYAVDEVADVLIERYAALPDQTKPVALGVLVSRPSWARQLLRAVAGGKVPRADIPLDVVQRLLLIPDAEVASLAEKLWPGSGNYSNEQIQKTLQRVIKAANMEGGNLYKGRHLFLNICGKCHLLFGEGSNVGPDLTTYERRDVQRLALQIVNPSLEIREGFEPYAILTTDGRVLVGLLRDQDEQVVVLRTAEGSEVTVPRDQIEELVRQPKSIMPEGLLDSLTDEQIRDLFSYLKSGQPVRD